MTTKRRASKARPTRREFVSTVLVGAAAGCSSGSQTSIDGSVIPDGSAVTDGSVVNDAAVDQTPKRTAADVVTLGATGIRVSRLAMGSGTHGQRGASDQTRLGMSAFVDLFAHGFSRGLTFFDAASDYGSHAYVKAALDVVGRQNVVILTKSLSETAAGMQADLNRFRTELGTDVIDIVLLHGKTSGTWTTDCAGAMDVLSLAKQNGVIRAHGISSHTLPALQLAAQTPWVDVNFAQINPAGIRMASDPATVTGVLRQMKAAGKGVVGIKILGEGMLANDLDSALRFAMSLDVIDAFSIGFTSLAQLDQVFDKITAVS